MKYNIKICFPLYKIIYSITFIIILVLVRPVSDVTEIGITLDTAIAVLSIVFCADTYELEYREKRWEVILLKPLYRVSSAIRQRLFMQWIYLLALAVIGYLLFSIRYDTINNLEISPIQLFLEYLLTVATTITLWSIIAMSLTNISKSIWAGIGISMIMWFFLISSVAKKILGVFNPFAYTYELENSGHSWLIGILIAIVITIILFTLIPQTQKKGIR